MAEFISIIRNDAPLLLSLPHTGTRIPNEIAEDLVSLSLARYDTDWWIEQLYDFAAAQGASVVRTEMSRTVIDVNRDPSGVSLYPGAATTGLCPLTTFDGEALYRDGCAPDVAARRKAYFDPYHAALAGEIARLRGLHERIVVYDAHSIRSVVPRLFAGTLPDFNIGTYNGASCDVALTRRVAAVCDASERSWVSNGRFKGGYITRHYGAPAQGVHAIQMELACAGYMREDGAFPAAYDAEQAAPMRAVLEDILQNCIDFTKGQK
jgi:N-formylglutamate deformylase